MCKLACESFTFLADFMKKKAMDISAALGFIEHEKNGKDAKGFQVGRIRFLSLITGTKRGCDIADFMKKKVMGIAAAS